MSKEELTYWDYVKAAFSRGHRVPLLGRMPFNQMLLLVFGALGVVNPGFWLAGVGAEVVYLATMSSNARFLKLVQGERLLQTQRHFDDRVQQAVNRLAPEARERYRQLLGECGLILGIAPTLRDGDSGTLADLRAGSLNQLLTLFLRLLTSRQVILTNLTQVDHDSLEAELTQLQARLAEAEKESALARSLAATAEIQAKRLANLQRAQGSLAVIDAELERIERQVRLIREETAVSGGPEVLSTRLDAVSQTLAETSRWMDQNAELLGGLATADLLDGNVPSLPRLRETGPETPPPPPPPRRKQRQGN